MFGAAATELGWRLAGIGRAAVTEAFPYDRNACAHRPTLVC